MQAQIPSFSTLSSTEDDDNGDFEFAFLNREPTFSPVSADEIFHNGQIKRTNNYLALKASRESSNPLRKLLTEERKSTTFCSEADELQCALSEVYSPKAAGCKKSRSARRLKLREYLQATKESESVVVTTGDGDGKKRVTMEGDKRKSPYLPFVQDFVGFLNANGLSRSLHPF